MKLRSYDEILAEIEAMDPEDVKREARLIQLRKEREQKQEAAKQAENNKVLSKETPAPQKKVSPMEKLMEEIEANNLIESEVDENGPSKVVTKKSLPSLAVAMEEIQAKYKDEYINLAR